MDDLEVKIAELEQREKSNSHRLDRLENENTAIRQIATSVEVLATEMEFMRKTQENFTERLVAIEKKPGVRLDQIVSAIIVAFVSICVGWVLGGVM